MGVGRAGPGAGLSVSLLAALRCRGLRAAPSWALPSTDKGSWELPASDRLSAVATCPWHFWVHRRLRGGRREPGCEAGEARASFVCALNPLFLRDKEGKIRSPPPPSKGPS